MHRLEHRQACGIEPHATAPKADDITARVYYTEYRSRTAISFVAKPHDTQTYKNAPALQTTRESFAHTISYEVSIAIDAKRMRSLSVGKAQTFC